MLSFFFDCSKKFLLCIFSCSKNLKYLFVEKSLEKKNFQIYSKKLKTLRFSFPFFTSFSNQRVCCLGLKKKRFKWIQNILCIFSYVNNYKLCWFISCCFSFYFRIILWFNKSCKINLIQKNWTFFFQIPSLPISSENRLKIQKMALKFLSEIKKTEGVKKRKRKNEKCSKPQKFQFFSTEFSQIFDEMNKKLISKKKNGMIKKKFFLSFKWKDSCFRNLNNSRKTWNLEKIKKILSSSVVERSAVNR